MTIVDRREFARLAAAGFAANLKRERATDPAAQLSVAAQASPKRALMKVGTQHGDSDPILRAMANEAQGFAFALGYIKALIAAVSD